MSEYYESDFADPEQEVIRPRSKKKHDSFEYCKWAVGDWEARFYAWTKTHRAQCEAHIKQLTNNTAWYQCKPKKIDKKAAANNNKARSSKSRGKRRQA